MRRYQITLLFNAPRITVALLRWVVRMYGDPEAPDRLSVRIERVS